LKNIFCVFAFLLVFIQLRIMKTANYTENEKIILASFVREMGGEIENKKKPMLLRFKRNRTHGRK
jgi:hypothetical protein